MNDRNTSGAAAQTDFSSTRNPPTNFSSSSDQPPDYSTCVSQPTTVHNSHQTDRTIVNPMSGHNASETFPLKGIHRHDPVSGNISHGTTSSAPFLDVASDSENLNDGMNPLSNPYNPQPAYNPSYPAERQITPRPNVYGRKTIVLQRTAADISARNRKIWMSLGIGLLIGVLICGTTLAIVFSIPIKRTRWEDRHKANNNYDSNAYDRQISDNYHPSAIDPYLTDTYRNQINEERWKPSKSEEEPWKPSKIEEERWKPTKSEKPSWEDSYSDLFGKSPVPKNDDNAALRAIGIDPDEMTKRIDDLYKKQLETLNKLHGTSDDVVHHPSIIGRHIPDTLGSSWQQSSNDDKTTKSPPFQWK